MSNQKNSNKPKCIIKSNVGVVSLLTGQGQIVKLKGRKCVFLLTLLTYRKWRVSLHMIYSVWLSRVPVLETKQPTWLGKWYKCCCVHAYWRKSQWSQRMRGQWCIQFILTALVAALILTLSPLSDEIGLIPCPEARYNRSPIVLVENKLGVESWCVKFLLPYVHNKLLLYRQRKHWLDREGNHTLAHLFGK